MTAKMSSWLKTALKFLISAAALAFVFSKIDFVETWQTMRSANVWWLAVSVLVYVVSQVVCADRVRGMLAAVPVSVHWWTNMKLYWVGMFYNFFLPGGVGGDGYKVYWLHRRTGVKIKPVVMTILGDRISGLVAICCYTVGYVAFSVGIAQSAGLQDVMDQRWLLGLIPIGIYVYWLFFRIFQRNLCRASFVALFKSLVVQGLQMLTAFVILLALRAPGDVSDYLFLFLLSSIASAVPVTIGGVGAREMAFMIGSRYLDIDQACAISLSLLFYAVSLVSSLPGIAIALNTSLIDGKSVPKPDVAHDLADVMDEAEEEEQIEEYVEKEEEKEEEKHQEQSVS